MKCPKCGKDLPETVSFCPYCMEKFAESDGAAAKGNKAVKNRKSLIIILAVLIVVVVAAIIIAVCTGMGGQAEDESSGADLETVANRELSNPEKYCGTWYNEDFDGESPELEGGNVLKIISMNDSKVIFELGSYQSPPNSRVAKITGIEADIVDGQAEFIFADDGWGNGGIGTMVFLEDEIYVNIKLTSVSSDSLWNIGNDVKFKKVSESYETDSIDFMGVIGDDISVVSAMLGNLEYVVEETEGGKLYAFDGIYVNVSENIVTSVMVDYTLLPQGYREKLCFSFGINGAADYDYIEKKLGSPVSTYEDDGLYTSCFRTTEDNETYLNITFAKGEVLTIRYFVMMN